MIRRLHLPSEHDWLGELRSVAADEGAWERVRLRSEVVVLKAGPFPCPAANILKQCMLSAGGDAIVARGTIDCSAAETFAILIGTPRDYRRAAESLSGQPFGLSVLGSEIGGRMDPPALPPSVCVGNGILDFRDAPLVMGVLNVTPDSFSDGGLYAEPAAALDRALEMLAQGASVIDIGAESTRPGSRPVPPSEQAERLVPVVSGLASLAPHAAISVDTSSAGAAAAALDAGAGMINDVTALSDPEMAVLAADRGVPVILMHMKGVPATMQDSPSYHNAVGEVYSFLDGRVREAVSAGIPQERILIDPGIGFGKRLEDNLDLLRRLAEFRWLGCRTVVGYSRKSFLGTLTGETVPARRDAAGHAVAALALQGADLMRVHDVEGTVAALAAARALAQGGAV